MVVDKGMAMVDGVAMRMDGYGKDGDGDGDGYLYDHQTSWAQDRLFVVQW